MNSRQNYFKQQIFKATGNVLQRQGKEKEGKSAIAISTWNWSILIVISLSPNLWKTNSDGNDILTRIFKKKNVKLRVKPAWVTNRTS